MHRSLTLIGLFVASVFQPATFVSAHDALLRLPTQEDFHLFLLIGQSNMAGRGTVTDEDRVADPRVLVLNAEGQWAPATDPLHFDKPIAGVGLGRTFGLAVAEATPGVTIGLIPCAVGGSAIDAWMPGAQHDETGAHPWDDAMRRARTAMAVGTLKAILWHQGESDAKPSLAAAYAPKLIALVDRLRTELDAQEVPFLLGQLGRFPGRPWDESMQQVNAAHRDLPRHARRVVFVSSEGLRDQGDRLHFDAASYREFGRRFADAYLALSAPE